jgi:RNA polymerase sigma factor for flagellar operon FliA
MTAQPLRRSFDDAQPLTYAPGAHGRDLNALVKRHAPLVRRIAWHVHGGMSTAIDIEDLVQTGLVALVEAAGSFEERGLVSFEHYLATRVRGSMIDALRRQATLTRGAMRRRKAYQEAITTLTQQLGRAPAEPAIAAQLGVTIEKLRTDFATAEAVRFEPIDDVYSDDSPWFASDDPDAFEQLADEELREVLIEAITALPEREAQVVQLYYIEELNLEEIGLVLEISAARVCQIKASAHARLKKALARRG